MRRRPRLSAVARKKAENVKTDWEVVSRKEEVERGMRTRNLIPSDETTGRLRRGLNPADGPRRVATMARTACFSRRHFHRLTLQLMGETPGAHQRRLRLDRGAWLLLTSRHTVLEIALETGFETHETFTRAFRAQFGATPSAFRKSGGHTLPPSIRIAFGIARVHGIRMTNDESHHA